MKKHRYKFTGPAGEVEIKDPFLVRLVESTWMVVLLTVIGVALGVYFLTLADPRLFLGRGLSSTHRQFENNCYACHTPWKGVFNESCSAADCHPEVENTVHNTMDRTCISCHFEHTDGAPLKTVMENQECVECHRKMAADPESALHPQRLQSRQLTYVPRNTFRHAGHAPKPKCWECHCNGKDTINIDTKDLFKMKSCLVSGCHDKKQAECKYCHPLFHEQRSASLLTPECLSQSQLLNRLKGTKIKMYCTEYKQRKPNFGELTVCGTDELVIPPKPPPEPEPQEGDSPEPAGP